ncbi:cyclase family protein (plasmid) [Paracoccus denitrificans]|jgi:kynurenine formamidase|nr:cyclase family protein [Paracoccus denitrificans]
MHICRLDGTASRIHSRRPACHVLRLREEKRMAAGRRIVDLSVPIENTAHADPPGMGPSIEYFAHDATGQDIVAFFPGMTVDQLPGSEGWALEKVRLTTHNGTHVDAPYHYHSTMDGGVPAAKIDELPLDWFFGPGVKLDFRHLPDGHVVSGAEIEAELARIGHEPAPGEIVLVNTSAGLAYGQPDYVSRGCGMGREATLWLTERGIRVVGTDGWSWDAPFVHTRKRWEGTRDPGIIWEGHRAGMVRGYCQIEKLHNLEGLPPFGFMVSCFPVKIRAASAGWTRAVAIFDE